MHRLITLVLAAILLAGTPAAHAQTDDEARTSPTVQVAAGLDGFVAAGRPVVVTASVSTPLLVSGRLRLRGGGISVSRPVEVPAGASQSYELTAPPLADGTRLTVELLDPDGTVLVDEPVTLRSDADELAVGVIGEDDLSATLGRVRTIATDRPVAALDVDDDLSSTAFDALDYLVLLPEAEGRLADGFDWASSGGRLVIDSSLSDRLDLPDTPLPSGVQGVSTAAVGNGRVVVVEAVTARSAEDWASILRPVPLDLANRPNLGVDPTQGGLIQSASESGVRQVPALPWLLFAILGFAVAVGPVNFFVLSKLGNRDLAWVTIPALALVAVFGFWVAGRQRIAGTTVSHASIVVADGSTEVRSGVLVAAGAGGTREIEFDEDVVVYPESVGFVAESAELELIGPSVARVSLDQLAFAGLGIRSGQPEVELPSVTIDGDAVAVDNTSGFDFWAWGLVRGGTSVADDGVLTAGGSGSLAIPDDGGAVGFGFVDAVMNQRELWNDPERSNGLWSMTSVLTAETERSGLYFVGLTDDYVPSLSVDGIATEPSGMSMVAVRVDDGGGGAIPGGTARADVVGTGFINWIDWSHQRTVATDEMTVSFTLPDPTVTPTFRDSVAFGVAPARYEAWHWERSEFVEIAVNDEMPAELRSPDGDVLVRLVGPDVGETPMSPDSLTLDWET